MQTLYNQIKPNKLLIFILFFAATIRIGMLYVNVRENPSIFSHDIQSLEPNSASVDKPLANYFGAEVANVAYSLVCKKEGLSNPFGGSTGPTGWAAPGMVMLYAVSFYLFGCFTFHSMLFMFLLALILSLTIIVLIYHLSIELFSKPSMGYIGALFFAVSPEDVFMFKRIHEQDFNIIAFMFLLLFCSFIKFLKSYSNRNLILFSLVAGMAILFNPVFVFPIMGCLLFVFVYFKNKYFACQKTMWSLAILLFVCTPYVLYQKQRLHVLTFIKSNALFELYQGNVPDFDGVLTTELFEKYHPFFNENEYKTYKSLGEIQYIKSKVSVFKQHFDFNRFIMVTGKRFVNFFFVFPLPTCRKYGREFFILELVYPLTGLALLCYYALRFNKKDSLDGLMYIYILSYAFPYCLTGMMYRYSFPIVPLRAVLFSYIIYSLCTSAFSHNTGRELTT
jgi:hypothetical protein